MLMKNFTLKKKIYNFRFVAVQIFFVSAATVAPLFLPEVLFAQSTTTITTTTTATSTATTTDPYADLRAQAALKAAATAQQQKASTTAEEQRLAAEQVLRQLESVRGMLPNSTINALEKTNKVGAYAENVTTTTAAGKVLFTRNLKQGDRGADVLALQKILNQNVDTQIASTGPGSPGNETDFFGALTKAAVIRFQNKHIAEILTPNGLTSGTGLVGVSTRAVLNKP